MVRFGGKDYNHRHIPSAWKALEGVVFRLHALICEIHRACKGDDNDRYPAGPPGQQATGKERIGRNEYIGEIINDQIEQHPVKKRCISFDVIATGQGAIYPINEKCDHQPDKHHVPFFIDRFQHCQYCKNSSSCSQQVNRQGFNSNIHTPV